MANLNNFIPFILKWEGGYVNDPNDLGGKTNMGVTLKTWQNVGYDKNDDGVIDEEDLKQVFIQDVIECVLRPHFWNRWKADQIHNQSIADILVDWLWLSGDTAITTTQRMLNIDPDKEVGEETLVAINDYPDQRELFDRIKAERAAYIERICKNRPTNRRFKKGWMNRLNDIRFTLIFLLCLLPVGFSACKSVVSTEKSHSKTETAVHAEKESEQLSRTRSDEVFSKQSSLTEDTETVMEKITVRFDTALLDSISGKHPVKEITATLLTQRKAIRDSSIEASENHRTDTVVIRNQETTQWKRVETVDTQKFKFSNPRLRLYAILVFIVVIAIGCWMNRKKISAFFYPLQKR